MQLRIHNEIVNIRFPTAARAELCKAEMFEKSEALLYVHSVSHFTKYYKVEEKKKWIPI